MNIKTLKNSGAYGFIHGKTHPITPDQAAELKERLKLWKRYIEKILKTRIQHLTFRYGKIILGIIQCRYGN